jgi:ribonuclease J
MMDSATFGEDMRVRIHRGTQEIGGSCIELANDGGERIVLDVGRPLWADWDEEIATPDVSGFAESDASLLGVIISHPHLDHYGLLRQIRADVPVLVGREASALLEAASYFSPISGRIRATGFLEHRRPFALGGFTITPFLNDHSAFDAYSLLIEAGGCRLFYTGDIRGHGRKAAMFQELLDQPPTSVDTLLMEGTHVRRDPDHDNADLEREDELEERFVELCESTVGAVAVFGSAQNLDRLVTVYRAAKRTRRQLVVDLYGATVAAATRPTIPQPGFEGLRVYVPNRQRVLVKQSREFERVERIKSHRVFLEEVAAHPERFMFHVPSSTARELIRGGALTSTGTAAWSLWDGYLRQRSGLALAALLAQHQIAMPQMHTSGHASVKDLRRLVGAIRPARVVPIHSEAGDRYPDLFDGVDCHADGDWWEVRCA